MQTFLKFIFTARRYASAAYAVVVCPSVRPFVRLSHAGIVPKRLNLRSRKQRHAIAPDSSFFYRQKSRQNSNGVIHNGGTK